MNFSLLASVTCASSAALFDAVSKLSPTNIRVLYREIIPILQHLKGADVDYRPMYPNFPKQVMEATWHELFWNAITHYWTAGAWLPEYTKHPRAKAYEAVKFRTLELTTPAPTRAVFTKLLGAYESISASDKAIIQWLLQNTKSSKLKYPKEIPFLENKCVVAALLLEQGNDITHLVATSTDILRIATYLSGGDVSLATNTRFKSFSRPLRRELVKQLERVINEEDIARHRKKWIKLLL